MVANLSTFLVRFPEFEGADTPMVQAHLDEQIEFTRGTMTDAERESMVYLRTADALAFSPFARDLKLLKEDGKSIYQPRLSRLLAKVTIHRRFV